MPWDKTPEDRRRDNRTYGPEYKRNRATAMRRDKWRCQIRTPGLCAGAAATCDHIVPVSQGGGHGLDNLRAACRPCHAAKTATEGGRKPGQDGTRTAADPQPRPRTAW